MGHSDPTSPSGAHYGRSSQAFARFKSGGAGRQHPPQSFAPEEGEQGDTMRP
jgi:hypothetical protein